MTEQRPEIRVSDQEREQYAEVLREALAEGRLTMEEFDERLNSAYRARTRGELEPLTRDLPRSPGDGAPSREVAPASGAGWAARIGRPASGSRTMLGVLGGFARRGRWVVPRTTRAVAFWGGGQLDLRAAYFEDREVTINATAIMGGVHVIVPEGVELEVRGLGIMGGFDQSASQAGEPGAPRVVVTGFAFWGGVGVERKPATDAVEGDGRERRRELGGSDRE